MAEQLFEIASVFEPKIKESLLNAFAEIKSEVDLDRLEEAIRTQGLTGVNQILSELQIEGIIEKELIDDINEAIITSGRQAITLIPSGGVTETVFFYNILNPITSQYIRDYQFSLVQTISNNTRQAIRNSVEAGIITGINPKQTAKLFQDTIGLTPKQELAVRNYRNYLTDLDRQALNRDLRDKRFDPTIKDAISTGDNLSEEQIDKIVDAYRKRFINFRAETIARTESLRAVSIGEHTSVIQAADSGTINSEVIKRFWIHADDKLVRNEHRQIPGLNPDGVGINQPFVTPDGPLLFPRDPRGTANNTINCRCFVIYRIID